MKKLDLLKFLFFAIAGTLLACSQSARALAPAGPVSAPPPGTTPTAQAPEPAPLPPPRQSILGAWKLSRSFELSPDGRQLYETLNMKLGRNNYDTSIRYVYDISAQKQQ